jgi:hypothetical protein
MNVDSTERELWTKALCLVGLVHRRRDTLNPREWGEPARCVADPRNTASSPSGRRLAHGPAALAIP